MQIHELLEEEPDSNIKLLKTHCSKFFLESGGWPLFKTLAETYPDFHRVKVRHSKKNNTFSTSLNIAFESERKMFSQRAIFASGHYSEINESLFYVFPTDDYQFLYNVNITNENSFEAFDDICEQFGDKKGSELIAEVLRFSYTPQNLDEGLKKGSDVILYGIPFYYAMRVTSVGDYDNVLTSIHKM